MREEIQTSVANERDESILATFHFLGEFYTSFFIDSVNHLFKFKEKGGKVSGKLLQGAGR